MSAAAIRSTQARRFAPTTYENVCNRCNNLVYSAEKIGPLKDFTFYHQNCFKCVVCGSKLTLKTYYNNQQDQDDKEVCFFLFLFLLLYSKMDFCINHSMFRFSLIVSFFITKSFDFFFHLDNIE